MLMFMLQQILAEVAEETVEIVSVVAQIDLVEVWIGEQSLGGHKSACRVAEHSYSIQVQVRPV
jgi:hypothetical protein